jgi:hypothetical protein
LSRNDNDDDIVLQKQLSRSIAKDKNTSDEIVVYILGSIYIYIYRLCHGCKKHSKLILDFLIVLRVVCFGPILVYDLFSFRVATHVLPKKLCETPLKFEIQHFFANAFQTTLPPKKRARSFQGRSLASLVAHRCATHSKSIV